MQHRPSHPCAALAAALLLGLSGAAIVCMSSRPARAAADCSHTSTGLAPLNDLASGTYSGFEGGLYPGGANNRPAAHELAGIQLSLAVVPRDTLGNPASNGRVVLLTIGMSNTALESQAFVQAVQAWPGRHPRLLVVNGAQGGQTAAIIQDPNATFWSVIDQRLRSAGVRRPQVQAVWFKEANAGPTEGFPAYAETLQAQCARIMHVIHDRYPNCRLCYCSSRIYGGYAGTALNPEPYAYWSGFAVKWLIEAQIDGDPALNFDAASGALRSPWLAWGPYLWADGLTPRSDGLTWVCSDVRPDDGTHPAADGSNKVAAMLLDFFRTDTTSRDWFSAAPTGVDESTPAVRPTPTLESPSPNPFNPATTLRFTLPSTQAVRVDIYDQRGRWVRALLDGQVAAGPHQLAWDGADAFGHALPSGIYVVRLQTATSSAMRKATLVK